MGEGSWFDRRALGRSRLREAVSSRDSCTPQARVGHCPRARDATEGDSPGGKQGVQASRAPFLLRRDEGGDSCRRGGQAASARGRGEASDVFRGCCWKAGARGVADGSAERCEASSFRLGVLHGAEWLFECVAAGVVGLGGVVICGVGFWIEAAGSVDLRGFSTDSAGLLRLPANSTGLWNSANSANSRNSPANSANSRNSPANSANLRDLAVNSSAADADRGQPSAACCNLVERSGNPSRPSDEQPRHAAGSAAGVLHATRRPLDSNAFWLA